MSEPRRKGSNYMYYSTLLLLRAILEVLTSSIRIHVHVYAVLMAAKSLPFRRIQACGGNISNLGVTHTALATY